MSEARVRFTRTVETCRALRHRARRFLIRDFEERFPAVDHSRLPSVVVLLRCVYRAQAEDYAAAGVPMPAEIQERYDAVMGATRPRQLTSAGIEVVGWRTGKVADEEVGACPSFGKHWDPNAEECQECNAGSPEYFEGCRVLMEGPSSGAEAAGAEVAPASGEKEEPAVAKGKAVEGGAAAEKPAPAKKKGQKVDVFAALMVAGTAGTVKQLAALVNKQFPTKSQKETLTLVRSGMNLAVRLGAAVCDENGVYSLIPSLVQATD